MARLIEIFETDIGIVSAFERNAFPSSKESNPFHLSQAAFYGSPAHNPDRSDHPDETYASWIENQTILYALMQNKRLIVDLIDCPDQISFQTKYGVTPWQMVELANDGWLHLSIRDRISQTSDRDSVLHDLLNDPTRPSGYVLQHTRSDHVFVGLYEEIFFLIK